MNNATIAFINQNVIVDILMEIQNSQEENKLEDVLAKAKVIYTTKSELYCPYFNQKIALTSDGFNHL